MGFGLNIKLCVHRARVHEARQKIGMRSCKSLPPVLKVKESVSAGRWDGRDTYDTDEPQTHYDQ